jgi:ATP-binding cassette subfamily B protein
VQAFNQEGREQQRFADAVENTFATAKRRIRIRATMTAIVIALIFGAITMLMWQGAIRSPRARSPAARSPLVITGGLVAGAFGAH